MKAGPGRMRLGEPRDIDPGVALLEEIHRSAGHVQWLEDKVRGLEESELVWGKVVAVREKRSGGQGGDYTLKRTENRATINTWWDLYSKERDHLSRVCLAALKAGIEERRVRIAERGIDALEVALAAALTDLGLDPQDPRVRAVMGNRLREVVTADVFGDGMRKVAEVQGELVHVEREAPVQPRSRASAAPTPLDW